MSSSPCLVCTHYPSWGSGSSHVPPVSWYCTTSLPLMGIRINKEITKQPAATPGLTTPHGDQDLVVPILNAFGTELTTPHGDQDPLQLLGCERRVRSHYPSWGSGSSTPGGCTRRVTAHYPSWGSGSRARGGLRGALPNSLPLMGIRIPLTLARLLQQLLATHYPSWGSGSSPTRSRPRCSRSTHYPSWGSGSGIATFPSH